MSSILLLLPFATLIVLNLLPRGSRGWMWIPSLVVCGVQTALAGLYPFAIIDWSFMAPVQKAIGFTLAVDNLGVMLLVTAGVAGMAALCVASASQARARARFVFANLLLIALIGIDGIAMVRDLFSMYVFIELTSVCAFIMVVLRGGQPSFEGAWKYLILSAIASVFLLTSLGCFLLSTGGISFDEVAAGFATPTPLMWVAGGLFLCGLFVKGAMVPFHGWLADAYTEADRKSTRLNSSHH
jgi:multicomponent Na+:H+ antiporter subunit D